MSRSLDKSPTKPGLSVQTIVFAEIIWAVLALLFFLLFSVPDPGKRHSEWYLVGTTIFEVLAHLSAGILCLRNWRSPQIVSGRNVWLGIGLGTLCYCIGSIVFGYWEIGLGREPEVSAADFFYVLTYLFLGWGMVTAVASRRLNLEPWQWTTVVLTGIAAIALATWLTIASNSAAVSSLFIAPATAQSAPRQTLKPTAQAVPSVPASSKPTKPKVTPIKPENPVEQSSKTAKPSPQPIAPNPSEKAPQDNASEGPPPPAWVVAMEDFLQPFKTFLTFFYVIADVFLLIISITLLLAFWGGRFSQSWRMISMAAGCLYFADMWYKFATSPLYSRLYHATYESGGLLEVFFVFSGVLFAIGAALEYDLSRTRRATGRKRA